MLDKIEKITIYVTDQAVAKAFWTGPLGFKLTFEQAMGPAGTWIEVTPPGAQTALVLYDKALMLKQQPAMVSHPSVIFASTDVGADHAALAARGVQVDDLQAMPWGKMFNFRDPDGNRYMVRGA